MDIEKDKIIFKCIHCDNDDLRHMVFHSANMTTQQYNSSLYNEYPYEARPKIPIGVHIKCAKCDKDTFFLPENYGATQWGDDVPMKCIVKFSYEKPTQSAIQYIMTEDAFLDKIVVTNNNELISVITQEKITDDTFTVINKAKYEKLKAKGLLEVGLKSGATRKDVVNTNTNKSNTHNKGEVKPSEQ